MKTQHRHSITNTLVSAAIILATGGAGAAPASANTNGNGPDPFGASDVVANRQLHPAAQLCGEIRAGNPEGPRCVATSTIAEPAQATAVVIYLQSANGIAHRPHAVNRWPNRSGQ